MLLDIKISHLQQVGRKKQHKASEERDLVIVNQSTVLI